MWANRSRTVSAGSVLTWPPSCWPRRGAGCSPASPWWWHTGRCCCRSRGRWRCRRRWRLAPDAWPAPPEGTSTLTREGGCGCVCVRSPPCQACSGPQTPPWPPEIQNLWKRKRGRFMGQRNLIGGLSPGEWMWCWRLTHGAVCVSVSLCVCVCVCVCVRLETDPWWRRAACQWSRGGRCCKDEARYSPLLPEPGQHRCSPDTCTHSFAIEYIIHIYV